MIYLKQSTASQEVLLGPFLDDTDGKTAETGLTIANTDIKIFKAGATSEANKNSGGATHIAGGRYYAVLDATDTNTLGSGEINVHVSGALPVRREFCVLAANVYDALIGGGDLLDVSVTQFGGTNGTFSGGRPEVNATHWGGTAVASALVSANVTQISGDSAAADELERWMDGTAGSIPELGIVDRGTAQSATSTTLVLRSATAFADDSLIGMILMQTGGTNSPQAVRITDNVQSTDTVTVASWPNGTPGGTITYAIFGTAPVAAGGSSPTAEEIADAVWDEATSGHTTAGTFGKAASDILEDTGTTLPSTLAGLEDVSAQDIWDYAISSGFPAEKLLRIIAAVVAGKSADGGNTFRDVLDGQDMVTATVSSGERTAVTYGT